MLKYFEMNAGIFDQLYVRCIQGEALNDTASSKTADPVQPDCQIQGSEGGSAA